VIATDKSNSQVDRIDLATRAVTVLLSNSVLKTAPDSVVFISDTQVLVDFVNVGDIGLGDIQTHSFSVISQNHGTLRDMAVRPDNSGVLIAEQSSGTLLEFRVSDHSVKTFTQNPNLNGVQGLAFDSSGNLYAVVGGTVYQLDPTSGRQLKTFNLQVGTDGMAYDNHRSTLDIASGDKILALDPKTGKISTLVDGLGGADGVAVDRHGNLFIASSIGVLELNTDNQLLIVGTNSNGVSWDDVAPLSGSGAANY
jgi:sugar lactone lactonase YvrE